MKNKFEFRWVLLPIGMLILAIAIIAPIPSRADDAHDKDRPQLDGSVEQVLNRLSDRFHVHIDADWNELQAAGVSPQLSLRSIPAKSLDEGLAAVVSATHFRLTYVATPRSVRISAGTIAQGPAATALPASAEANSSVSFDDAKSDEVLGRTITDLNLDSVSLDDAFSKLAEATHADVVVHWRALNDASVDPFRKIRLHLWNVSLRTALRVIIAEADDSATPKIGFAVDDQGVLNISSVQAMPGRVVTRFYNIKDLVKGIMSYRGTTDDTGREEAVDYVMKLITDRVDPDSWRDAGGTIGKVHEINGVLVVTQSIQAQKQISAFIDDIRQHVFTP